MPSATLQLLASAATDATAVQEATGGLFGVISQWAIDLMGVIGAPGAGLAIFVENVFPPIPSEIILPLAGLAAHDGKFTLVEALLWTTFGSLLGAFLLYGLGRWLGHDRTVAIARKLPFIDEDDVTRTISWFQRHGTKAVFFGRMLPIFRSLISIPAGIEAMPPWRFGALTLAGSAIWNTLFVTAGFLLGTQWEQILIVADALKYLVYAGLALFVAWFVWTRIRKARAKSAVRAQHRR